MSSLTNTSLSTSTYTDAKDVNDTYSSSPTASPTRTKTTNDSDTFKLHTESNKNGTPDVTDYFSRSNSTSTLSFGPSSPHGHIGGGSSVSWTSTVNGTTTSGPAKQAPPYSYDLNEDGTPVLPAQTGDGTPPGEPLLERLGLGTNVGAAFAFGLAQGATNILNGLYNMAPDFLVEGSDWSRNTFVSESDGAHSLSMNVGAQGAFTLLTCGAGTATLGARVGCILQASPKLAAAANIVRGYSLASGVYYAGSEWVSFGQAVYNGDGYGAVEHGMLALMNTIDLAAAFGTSCFAAGTPILTPDGSKPIEGFLPGDWVLSATEHDPEAGPVPRRVEEVFQTFSPIMELRVGGKTIRTTAEHPFWVEGKGWTDAHQLVAGDRLRSADGRWVELEGAGGNGESVPVYNMRVAEYHTYFVGSEGWGFSLWAHNSNADCVRGQGPPNPGGRLGKEATRAQLKDIANEMERRGFQITGGGGKLPEEYLPGPGGGRKGSSFPDITATKNGRTVRVNTIDTRADGITPSTREVRNATRIRRQTPGDHLILIPKPN